MSSFPSTASTSQEDHESNSGSISSRKLRVTLLSSEWRSTKGGLSTINRELAIQLAKHPSVEVSVYLPECSEDDKRVATSHNVHLIEAEKMPGLGPDLWLSCLPEDHAVDCVIGHGAILGRQVQIIKRHHHCKWIQVVHTSPEELGMYKEYEEHISKGEEKHQVEVELCKLADQVVAIGPKLADAFSGYLRPCGRDQDVLNLTPGIFSEFAYVSQATEERNSFNVLVFGRGDSEDFQLKGYDIAAQAIAQLKDTTYKLMFVGATRGEEDKVAKKLVEQGIGPSQLRVRCFNESREKLADLFCEVDLAIMPSRTEGFGLAALEALSAGLPVLVSGNSGLAEALKKVPHGSSCVVESEDPKDWANAMRAVRHKDREMRLGDYDVVRGAYAKKYSWKEQCDKLVERMKIISSEGSIKGKRPLSPSSTPASKVPKYLGDEGTYSLVLVKLLKKEYKRRSQLRPLLWESTIQLPIEQVYTRLKIVSRGKLAIQLKKDDVNVFDIFKVSDMGEDVMTIVEGSPGIGKTTFCLKLAYDWAHGNIPSECSFPKFEFVFLLKCRDIDGDIMEAISDQLLPRDEEKSVEKLWHLMKDIRNQERLMLIILDGLDELPENSRHHVDELLNRRILAFCYVLATTRQERGIEVRKSGVVFDIHLEIKGYTESDSIAYVRRHFETLDQSPKGKRLIEEIEQNTFLHALRSNPLNLLLLCVIYEDYEGNLPTSRTELYQVIVQCLLRRYCAKHNLAVPEDNNTLQKRFEEDVLALGELAWACLLKDCQSFREGELAEREVANQNLVARKIGLLYKEESLKRIRPQHEYWFLHKTFQEYLAAAFITHKLLRGEFNVFEYTTCDDLVKKYLQVFLFVSGMMGEKATVLFTQIGKKLKEEGFWNWCLCSEQKATFFVEGFNESGHAEQMATTLCSILPFPEEIFLRDNSYPFVQVLIACKSFSKLLQSTVKLTAEVRFNQNEELLINCIESLSKLTTVTLTGRSLSLSLSNADRLCKCITASKSLSEFTLKLPSAINGDVLLLLCNGLALCKTLRNVKFSIVGKESEVYINALTTGLAPDTPLTSAIVLEIYGSMPFSAIQALQKLLMNKSLISLSLHISGDVHDYLVAAVTEALARQTVLKYFDLFLGGKLSSAGANSLKKGLLKNSSLICIKVVVDGELPDNWHSVVETLYSTKNPLVTYASYPNTLDNVAEELVDLVLPENGLVPNQHLTVNVWGKLSCEEAKAVCKVLVSSSLALLTLNVHGNLTDDVITSIASGLKGCKTLSFLSVNIWGNLSLEGRTILSALTNLNVHLNVHTTPEESNLLLDISVDNHSVLKSFFAKVKDTSQEKVSLIINDNSDTIKEWTYHLGNALAGNTSLTSLDLTLNNCLTDGNLEGVRESLLQSTSIKTLSLTINCCDIEGLVHTLRSCFAERTSFTTLSLEINDYSERYIAGLCETKVTEILPDFKLLSTLSVAVHRNSMIPFWGRVVDYCLGRYRSVKNLSLAFNSGDPSFSGNTLTIRDALARRTSLNTFSLAVCFIPHNHNFSLECLGKLSTSLTTLTITLSLCGLLNTTFPMETVSGFNKGLFKSKSITTLSLTVNEFGEGISDIGSLLQHLGVFKGLAQNKSVTTFNLTLNSSRKVGDDWLPGLCGALKKNSVLTTLRLKMNNHCATGESRLYDLRKLALESKSLSLLELEVSFYGKESY